MSMVPITFVTNDGSRWGNGVNRLLDAFEVDRNFWELKAAVEDIAENPPSPVQIASFTVSGLGMVITMTNGSTVGPLPLPILAWRWRDVWLPFVPYITLDVFQVVGVGIFLVLRDHTADATFDPNARDLSDNPLYQELFAFTSVAPWTMDPVTTGLSHTVVLPVDGIPRLTYWSSATVGAKHTAIPGSGAVDAGRVWAIKTTLGNGDLHTVTPAAGTIEGDATLTFNDNKDAISLISDGVSNWMIAP